MSARMAPTRRMTAAWLGNMPTTRARRLISLLTRSRGLVLQILGQWGRGKAVKASTSALAASINGPIFGKRPASWSRTSSQVAGDGGGVGLGEDGAKHRGERVGVGHRVRGRAGYGRRAPGSVDETRPGSSV